MNKIEALARFAEHTVADTAVLSEAIDALEAHIDWSRTKATRNTVQFFDANGTMIMDFSTSRVVWRPGYAPANSLPWLTPDGESRAGLRYRSLTSGRMDGSGGITRPEPRGRTCPACWVEMSVIGVCDTCD